MLKEGHFSVKQDPVVFKHPGLTGAKGKEYKKGSVHLKQQCRHIVSYFTVMYKTTMSRSFSKVKLKCSREKRFT